MTLREYIEKNWKGTPYEYGGKDKSGIDCSGLIYQVWKNYYKKDIAIKTANTYMLESTPVDAPLKEGDLVFFTHKNDGKAQHVGIMVDVGNFAHSSTSKGVIITPLNNSYWKPRILTFGQLI